jgi:Tol biopolymer transport system component
MAIAIGTCIGPYEITARIGVGGMGEVYRARDPRLGRDVAIKLISEKFATDPSRVHRFEQEARAAGQINHPNILSVYDIGSHAGTPYIVSEFLEGESFGSRLQAGPLPIRKIIDYARQTAAGLAAAHDKNLVHRDLKPDNLFITNDGRVKILDFGIAKLTGPGDDASRPTGFPTETVAGMVVGTQGYMSPEQVRGEAVDARSDLFSFGAVFYELLTSQPAFIRGTGPETMAAILKEDPPEPPSTISAPGLMRIISRCLEKAREARFQSARDLGFALEFLSGTGATSTSKSTVAGGRSRRWRTAVNIAVVVLSILVAAASWLTRDTAPPLVNATFTLLTNWEGTEEGAEISPDGKFVAFLSDRAGEYDIWLSQLGTGYFTNLTSDFPPLAAAGFVVRKLGFSDDGSEIWFNPGDGQKLMIMPAMGGTPRPFLREGANTPAFAPDGSGVVYVYKGSGDDPVYLADRNGLDRTEILPAGNLKNMNPVFSPDGQWIFFGRGLELAQNAGPMDVWRLRPSGGAPEQVTRQRLSINFLAPLDARRLLFVAYDEDQSGPWLFELDVQRGRSRRVPSGIDQYTSVATSRNGQRAVATVVNPGASLWRVPILGRLAEERDVEQYPLPVPTGVARAPRFGGKTTLFYLSARGTRDGLWKLQDGRAAEVWRGVDAAVSEPAAVSPDGQRVVVVVTQGGKRHLSIMSADGTGARTLAPSVEINGAAGEGAVDWSPDGTRLVAGGRDDKGPALFVIPVDTGVPIRLREGKWVNPIWSPNGDLIVYSGASLIGQVALLGVRPDGTPVEMPNVLARPGGYRFLPDGKGLVYLPRIPSLDFWTVDLATAKSRALTSLSNLGALRTFDITSDGKYIVFDRSRQNANIVLIDMPKP